MELRELHVGVISDSVDILRVLRPTLVAVVLPESLQLQCVVVSDPLTLQRVVLPQFLKLTDPEGIKIKRLSITVKLLTLPDLYIRTNH